MERPLTVGQLARATGVPAKPFATMSRWVSCRCHGGVTQDTGTTPATMSTGSVHSPCACLRALPRQSQSLDGRT